MLTRNIRTICGAFALAISAALALPTLVHSADPPATATAPAATASAGGTAATPTAPTASSGADGAASAQPAASFPPAPKLTAADYPTVKGVNARVAVWLIAQLHLWFGAFVVAVPMFVFMIEAIGMATRDKRYDNMAYEFIKVTITAYSLTALLGGLLCFGLVLFYPDLFKYLALIFKESMFAYALLFFAESAVLYIYYYGWHWLQGGNKKWVHLTLGLLLNAVGLQLMFLANAWTTFMMSPAAVDAAGVFNGNTWAAIHNYLWNPINIHRVVANVAYGGSVVGAYAAFKFLSAQKPEERAHYDWMGYNANFIAIAALLPLPFAGYYLTAEIYAYSQQMGITLMGGVFAWLFIIQAVLIGALFLSANYYLWCGMGRSDGAYRYNPRIKYIAVVLVGAFLVWFTPHTLVLTNSELKGLGGPYHKYLGALGIMPAKNTAVNFLIVFTFLSFLFYRRANKIATVSWAAAGNAAQVALFTAGLINITILGVYYGYFTNTVYKVAASVPQVLTTLVIIIISTVIDAFMYKGAKDVAPLRWGRMPDRSQYALFLLAVSFTWLMGLMGYVRSGIRQHWHVSNIFRDSSPDAYTPGLGYAASVVSVGTILFMAMVIFVFWLSTVSGRHPTVKGYWKEQTA
ncbi:MAG: cytochrome ubiquinol oxidase subunit I [Betaproteobacteria bacterium]|nr:cytochrome ubiquinol oxidase subunit I [Betaproteobacteria bacterium]